MLVSLVLPHQLYDEHPALVAGSSVYLVEAGLFFTQYHFHRQKIHFHRASMQYYRQKLMEEGYIVHYIEAHDSRASIPFLLHFLAGKSVQRIRVAYPDDDWIEKHLHEAAAMHGIRIEYCNHPGFLINREHALQEMPAKDGFRQVGFYQKHRKKLGWLMDEQGKPIGGQWSFDADNRKPYPKNKIPPPLPQQKINAWQKEANSYVHTHFESNPGQVTAGYYPVTHTEAEEWLEVFLQERFQEFGPYEDAIVKEESLLHHSLLSPLLNAGLLTPQQVLNKSMAFGQSHAIPLASMEGFLRQVMGWREFIRVLYQHTGRRQRSRNFWGHHRKIPAAFWKAETGIFPVDNCIQKILKTGYCHHIERLMVLGNFMLLCRFDPDEVYRWFMEMFIDAYDWVMVPNVYGMSQFADGGLMSTKPYISGSHYLKKMSNYPSGAWEVIWDGLFWTFMDDHRNFFLQNPRLGMLIKTFDKMPESKKSAHRKAGSDYLAGL